MPRLLQLLTLVLPIKKIGLEQKLVRDWITNGLVVIVSIVVTYLAAEAAFSLVALRYVPLRLHEDLPVYVRIFAQSSKGSVVPREPVLLLGDSYAQGAGDWLRENDPSHNGSFHSAHVIHQLVNRDVITLGLAGAGSVESVAVMPAIAYAYAKDAWYLRLPQPHTVVVYFYEGNDLNDNLRFLKKRVGSLSQAGTQIDSAIAAYASKFGYREGWERHFPFFLFGAHIVWRVFAKPTVSSDLTLDNVRAKTASHLANVVEVAGQATTLPALLQSPSLELTTLELERASLVFERSLVILHKILPNAPILVAYLPSPLSSYRVLSPEVSIQQYESRAIAYPKDRVVEYSDRICQMIRAAATRQSAGFLDTRPYIRQASARDKLHGPIDFKHFNRKGMEVLGQAVAGRIDSPLEQGACEQGTW